MYPDFIKRRLQALPPKRQRLLFVFFAALLCMGGVQLILAAFRDNIIYFYTPTELSFQPKALHTFVRVGGLVEQGSLHKNTHNGVDFIITDGGHRLNVTYSGLTPDLFREGQGVIAEGMLTEQNLLTAQRILAKHDENYMPKQVVTRLKQSGYWRGGKPAAPQ